MLLFYHFYAVLYSGGCFSFAESGASKDDEVVEFALSRSLSPTMVAEYNLKLIDKKLLQKKLKEYIELAKLTE